MRVLKLLCPLFLLLTMAAPAVAADEKVSLAMPEGIVSDMLSECLEAEGFVLVDRGLILPEVQARGLTLADLFGRQDVALSVAEKLHQQGITRVVIVADVKAWQSDTNEDLGYETWRARIRLLAIDGSTGDELVRDQNEDKESRSGSEKARDAAIRRTMMGLCERFARELREKLGGGTAPPTGEVVVEVEPQVHLLVDASHSMATSGRFELLRQRAIELAELGREQGAAFGLRAYGHQQPYTADDLQDTELLAAPGTLDAAEAANELQQLLSGLQPRGQSLLATALEAAAADVAAAGGGVVVLLSDGQETAGGDPALAAQRLAQAGLSLVVLSLAESGSEEEVVLQRIASRANGVFVSHTLGGWPVEVEQLIRSQTNLGFDLRALAPDEEYPQPALSNSPAGSPVSVYVGPYELTVPGRGSVRIEVGENDRTTVRVRGSQIQAP